MEPPKTIRKDLIVMYPRFLFVQSLFFVFLPSKYYVFDIDAID